MGQRAIVRALNEDRVPTAPAGPWHQSTITKILSAVVYVGKLEYKGEIFDGAHEAIVAEEVWASGRGDPHRRATGVRVAVTRTGRTCSPAACSGARAARR